MPANTTHPVQECGALRVPMPAIPDKRTLRGLDCFYTLPEAASRCLSKLQAITDFNDYDLFIEPSAGSGAFLDILPQPRIGLDIMPADHPEIVQTDFLRWKPHSNMGNAKAMVVGNPPFGKNSSLAVKFVNHAATFSDCIAFILPRTFRKASVVNRLDANLHLKLDMQMPEASFEFAGEVYLVPTVFQVWQREDAPRKRKAQPASHGHFDFVDKRAGEFAIQRVGANAGKIKMDTKPVSPNSHYFIKPRNRLVIKVFQSIDWSAAKYNTAGNPSIAKSELVNLYAKAVKQYA